MEDNIKKSVENKWCDDVEETHRLEIEIRRLWAFQYQTFGEFPD
jgi:hypothetical protein